MAGECIRLSISLYASKSKQAVTTELRRVCAICAHRFVPSSPKPVSATSKDDVTQHTIRVPKRLELRVAAAMEIEGLRTYNDFVLSALTRRCRDIEREHGIDPVKSIGK